ncbi:MAG: RNA methyltransferase [Burkholderiaceae bacterium]|jgi:TrmH family RNA methyltransferase|nr:RNA methyltransferase [Burkholderiaceae bacterium]MCO5102961.1 RNA methyltransferase [Burkholderiaceae bacterium]
MNAAQVTRIASRDNAMVKELRRLAQEPTQYRRQGRVWLEGEHLCSAAQLRGRSPTWAVFSESFWPPALMQKEQTAIKIIVLTDALFASVSALGSPAGMGCVIDLPAPSALDPLAPTVVLDRVQDAGNVGSILRSSAAFGFRQVLALKGTAALWSPKVLRAGMGAHFGLELFEGLQGDALHALAVPLLVTHVHGGDFLHRAALPWPCAWVLGHEGQGVAPALQARASARIRIAQPGGEESLNVAAAAAICLHASACAR